MAKFNKPKSPRKVASDMIADVRRQVQRKADGEIERVAGIGKQIKGTIAKAAGKVIDDARLQADGKIDRLVGVGKQIKGSFKQSAGKVIGDAKLQVEGEIDRVEGKAQDAVGKIKESLRLKTAKPVAGRRFPRSH